MQSSNAYDELAPLLVAKGLRPIPIGPGTKKPSVLHNGCFILLTDWTTRPPITTPQPGAGIGLVMGWQGLVAMDLDNDDIAIALLDILPDTPVRKFGQRGETLFFYAPGLASRKFLIEKKTVCEILAVGTQTVLPPTTHPQTGQPYRWTGPKTLLDIKVEDLPCLPDDIVERIEKVLEQFGYAAEPGRDRTDSENSDSPFRALNDLAIKNLEAWVPALGIYSCKRRRGFHASYEAVASWRLSTEGRELHKRERNLKISPKGIRDFGDGRKYTAIDLVMAARECLFEDAVAFLDEKLGWSSGGPEIVIDVPPSTPPEENVTEEESKQSDTEEPQGTTRKGPPEPPAELGKVWHCGDPIPPQLPMLVPRFVPARGFGYFGGQWGSYKTFQTVDLAVAVACGGKYAGEQVTARGAVVQVELEGSENEARLQAALAIRGLEGQRLPIVQLKAEPPQIIANSRLNPAFIAWARKLVDYAKAVAAYHEVPLALITIDPQNRIAGFRDEQSSSEGQIVSGALSRLAAMAECTVAVVDHYGKQAEAGLRGTSAKETNPLFILSVGKTAEDIGAKRTLEVRKMRNGEVGLVADFSMEPTSVTVEQLTEDGEIVLATVRTLAIRWGDAAHKKAPGRPEAEEPSPQERRALLVLNEMIAKTGQPLPPECSAPTGIRGVKVQHWYLQLLHKTILEGKNTRVLFSSVKNALWDAKQIDIGADFVWVPLTPGP